MSEATKVVLGVTVPQSLRFLGPLPELLSEIGWEVHTVSSARKKASNPEEKGIHAFHEIKMARQPSLIRDFHSLILWIRLIQEVRPSIVSVGTPKASLLGMVASRLLRVPGRIYVLRGLRLETTRGLKRAVLFFFEWITSSSATHVIAVSHSLQSEYLRLGLCNPKKIRVIGSGSSHGVNTQRFFPRSSASRAKLRDSLGLAEGVATLGFVGRFSRDKGADALVSVRRKLTELGIDHEFILIGSVEDSEEELYALNGYGRPVKALGEIDNVEDYYPLMTLLLLPTRREGFPNIVLEAGATAIPVITTNVTGARDSVIHGVTGIIVKSENVQDFASEVAQMLQDTEKLLKLGCGARERVLKEFQEIEVCERLRDFYLQVRAESLPAD